jgi:hypothetical protein
MKTLIFLAVSLISFPLFGQYNPGKLNSVKIGSSYDGYSGLEFTLGFERNITAKQSIYGTFFKSQFGSGFSLGTKYNLLSYKWIEAFAGLDVRSEYQSKLWYGREGYSYNFTIEPTLELRFNVNKTHFITTGMQFCPIYSNKELGDGYFLNRLNIGVSRRF